MAKDKPKGKLTDKAAALVTLVKDNWHTPRPGEYTSMKEFLFYCLGIMGVCGFTFI